MTISALVLYGSCARNENTANSDVDLFALTSHEDYRMVVQNKSNIALYPVPLALKMAQEGDLFLLHVVTEGRVLYDSAGDFSNLQASFKFKNTYKKEISNASELGWAIIKLGKTVANQTLVNKRIAWCVRTILIAKAAEERKAIFSASALTQYSGDQEASILIENKESNAIRLSSFREFEKFLSKWSNINLLNFNTFNEYQTAFIKSQNIVGYKTLRAFANDKVFNDY